MAAMAPQDAQIRMHVTSTLSPLAMMGVATIVAVQGLDAAEMGCFGPGILKSV